MGFLPHVALTFALSWPIELCFLLTLQPAKWWITLTADPTQVNDTVLQRGLQDGAVYQSKLQLICRVCRKKQEYISIVVSVLKRDLQIWKTRRI